MKDLRCIFCGSSVDIENCENSEYDEVKSYIGCEHEDCTFCGPIHKTREAAIAQYRKIYDKINEKDIRLKNKINNAWEDGYEWGSYSRDENGRAMDDWYNEAKEKSIIFNYK